MKSSTEQSHPHTPLWKIRSQRFALIGCFLLVAGAVADLLIMPWYTRQGATLQLVNTVGMTVSDAQDVLMRDGYRIEEIEKTDPNAAPGTIILQTPQGGATVKVGRKIYLTVSKGLAPVLVPRIQGSQREARLLIENGGLRVGRVDWDVSDYFPEGVVMFQSLSPGSRVQSGSYIDITISLGRVERSRTVPDVRNMNIEVAIKTLVKSGLNSGRVDTAVFTPLLPNTVLWQDRMPGEISMLGDTVNLMVNTIDSTYQAQRFVMHLLDSLVRAQGLEP